MAYYEIITVIVGLIGFLLGTLMFWTLPGPKLPGGKAVAAPLPLVSIIIPARNEARRISPLLTSLQAQHHQHFEVLVVDDHSTDGTAEVARDYGATVLSSPEASDGAGKSAACWYGAKRARGQWLLFLDADTYLLRPDSLLTLLTFYHQQGARGILSLQPFHTVVHLYEHLSAIFNIMVIAGMNVFTVAGSRLQTAGSFGPCILCHREDYMSTGGHEVIQEAVMDDLALGQAFLNRNLPVQCMGGRGIICFRMYPEGIKSLIDGWCKSFALGSKETHPLVMLMSILWISGSLTSAGLLVLALIKGPLSLLVLGTILYGLYMLQTWMFARRCGDFRWPVFALHPLLFLFFIGLFSYSLFRVYIMRSVQWRDRKIKL